jgi:hypothetical protein
MNKNYKSCENGHFYASTFESCPHCKNQAEIPSDKNSFEKNELDTDKTTLIGNLEKNTMNNDKTQATITQEGSNQYYPPSDEGDKTRIVTNSGGSTMRQNIPASRKLVGWLVSYTISDLGVDFKLFEGQNIIGRDPKSNIRITEDPSISSKHATILFRGNHFYLRDEMSTNPSFVNKVEVMPGNTIKLNDGDTIKVGDTELLIRQAIIKTE